MFDSLLDLQPAIKRFLTQTNQDPKPFIWTADPNRIIAAVRRGYQVLGWIAGSHAAIKRYSESPCLKLVVNGFNRRWERHMPAYLERSRHCGSDYGCCFGIRRRSRCRG